MFFACGIWCLADVSSVISPSSEQISDWKTSLKKLFSTWANTLNMGLINKG